MALVPKQEIGRKVLAKSFIGKISKKKTKKNEISSPTKAAPLPILYPFYTYTFTPKLFHRQSGQENRSAS